MSRLWFSALLLDTAVLVCPRPHKATLMSARAAYKKIILGEAIVKFNESTAAVQSSLAKMESGE